MKNLSEHIETKFRWLIGYENIRLAFGRWPFTVSSPEVVSISPLRETSSLVIQQIREV